MRKRSDQHNPVRDPLICIVIATHTAAWPRTVWACDVIQATHRNDGFATAGEGAIFCRHER